MCIRSEDHTEIENNPGEYCKPKLPELQNSIAQIISHEKQLIHHSPKKEKTRNLNLQYVLLFSQWVMH